MNKSYFINGISAILLIILYKMCYCFDFIFFNSYSFYTVNFLRLYTKKLYNKEHDS